MEKIPFHKVKDNQFFVWCDFLHKRIDNKTAIAAGYAASNGMEHNAIVSVFSDEELAAIREGK